MVVVTFLSVADAEMPGEKRMRPRCAGACRVCDVEPSAKTMAVHERSTKTVRCLTQRSWASTWRRSTK